MKVTLHKANESDCPLIHKIQVASFAELLEKYQDYDTNPAAESQLRVCQRFQQTYTDYYLIYVENCVVGMMRVCNYGHICRLSPICILPEFCGRGYAQKAMIEAEIRYPLAQSWELDTIAQEEKLCSLYERMGYRKMGKTRKIKEGMDLVFYSKEVRP